MIEVHLTKVIAEAERFDSEADARRAAQLVGVELPGRRPQVNSFVLDDEMIHIVYVGSGYPEYLKGCA